MNTALSIMASLSPVFLFYIAFLWHQLAESRQESESRANHMKFSTAEIEHLRLMVDEMKEENRDVHRRLRDETKYCREYEQKIKTQEEDRKILLDNLRTLLHRCNELLNEKGSE